MEALRTMTRNTTASIQTAVAMMVVAMLFMSIGISANGGITSKTPYAPVPKAVTGFVYWPNGTLDTTVSIQVVIKNNNTGATVTTNVDVAPGGLPDGNYQANINVDIGHVVYISCIYNNMWAQNQTVYGGEPFLLCDLQMLAFQLGPQLIGAATGGSITGYNGSVTLDFPAGALSSNTIIYGVGPQDSKFGSFGSISLGPDGLMFNSPATLTWSYSGLDIGEVPEETLAIYTTQSGPIVNPTLFDTEPSNWVKLPSTVDTQAKLVIAQVGHFSNFSLGGAMAFGDQTGLLNVYPGTLNAPILDLTVMNSHPTTDDVLDYVNVISNSTDDADISGVSLWNDLDNDRAVGFGDVQIGVTQPAGSANFSGLALNVPANTSLNLLVALDVSGAAVVGNALDLFIPAAGIGIANAGLLEDAIDPAGNVTISAELVDPHAVYGFITSIGGPVPFASVNMTNNRTGTIEFLTADSLGRYELNLGFMAGGYEDADEIFVQANDTLGQTGWNKTWVDAINFGERCDVYLGRGPIASDESPVNGSTVFDILQNITVNITGPLAVDGLTIILEVDGVNYTLANANLTFVGNTLIFNTSGAVGSWSDAQTVNVTLWQANDTAGNPCQNAPYSWWFLVSLGVVEFAPDIRIHKAGADLNITWAPVTNATSYNIYRSLAVNGTGFNFSSPIGTASEAYFIDAGALADVNNYSYVVRGNCAGGEGPKSNIGWKLRKQLVENAATSDINWIALPYNSDLKLAQDLIVDLGGAGNVNYVSRWVASTQSYQNRFPVSGFNWPITPGEGLLVNIKTDMIYTIVGSFNNTTMVNLLENPTTSDINWISLPYHSQLYFAQDLILNLGGGANINYVSRWVASTQSYQNKFPVVGFNWPITPGDAILVNVKVTISNYNLGPVHNP